MHNMATIKNSLLFKIKTSRNFLTKFNLSPLPTNTSNTLQHENCNLTKISLGVFNSLYKS